jgi:hypothetical protein
MSMQNLISINIKYHGHEKADVNLPFSYPCWWIRKGDEIVIKRRDRSFIQTYIHT